MRIFHKEIVFLILLSYCTFCLSACANTPNPISYKDVVIENLRHPYTGSDNNIQAVIIKDVPTAQTKLKSFGFSSDTINCYDSEYFLTNDLIVIIVYTLISNEYSVEKLEQSKEELNVILKEKTPPNVEDMLTHKGILINIAKNTLKAKTISVNVNSIKE